ncbi:hypothetical protein [Mesobacillus zeae]|uniref:HNH endonuclease n=1 Tax=Mesobacillus zeae TaxID=1917180 RepID=A0A398B6B8_9BACI|nr:hypothetical protein [Mesobacillus zeae]RID85649.1 hypothetical protein D1970_08830 [Mesobacillus zeae]
MFDEVRSYSKETQLRGHQKDKDTPKFKKKRVYTKKPKVNKNVEVFHNRRIPHWKERGEFSRKTKKEIQEIWGEWCFVCGNPDISHHHVYEKGYGKGGRGVITNGLPLCNLHHNDHTVGIHFNRKFYNAVREMFIQRFGPHYYKDKYDLWMEGHIENPTDELYKKFMMKEIKRCQQKNS